MATTVTFNGSTYSIPNTAGESGWETTLTQYLQALASGAAVTTTMKQTCRVATTTPVTVQATTDFTVVTNMSSASAVTVNLPAGATGRLFAIVDGKGDAATNNITIDADGAETINGSATYVINENFGGVLIHWNGTGWVVLADFVGNDPRFSSINVSGTATVGTLTATSGTVGGVAITTASNSQTLTNKTFDADGTGNSITNIENADIKSSAAIDRSKLASGTADHVVINSGTGAFSSEAQLNRTRGGTGISSTATFPSSGVVVTQAASESLTNKTFDDTSNVLLKGGNTTGATVRVGSNDSNAVVIESNNTDRITARVASSADADVKLHGTAGVELPIGTAAQRPSSPVAGTIRANSDSNEFEGYLNGTWASVGGGVNEQPLKNYLKAYATAAVSPGTLSTVAAGGDIATTAGLFYADTTSGSSALATSSSTALRGSFNYLSAVSGSDTAGGRFFQFPAFALESADLGKPVSLSFDITGLTATGWDVVVVRYNSSGTFQELISVAGTASASTSTASASLLTGTVQQRGFFVAGATSGDLYALRFRRISGAEQVRLDTLYVGPQQQLAGAPVTDWQAYTPSIGLTGATATGRWRQVGDSMEVQFHAAFTGAATGTSLTVGLPSGYSIDTTKLPNAAEMAFGTLGGIDGGVAWVGGWVGYNNTTSVIAYAKIGTTYQYNPVTPASPMTIASGDVWNGVFRVPIANWSSNVTMADRAVEEYAADDGSADVFGPNGVLVPNVGIGTTVVRDFVFQTSRQDTDGLVVEYKTTNAGWAPVENYLPGIFQGSKLYGVRGFWNNATTFRVVFGNGGALSDGATYGDNSSTSWQSLNIAGERWRVRKVSGGASVGYPIGARNVVGDTTGTAVPAGYIGERQQTIQSPSTANFPTSNTWGDLGSVSLTPGRWLVSYGITAFLNAATCTGIKAGIGTGAGTSVAGLANGDTIFEGVPPTSAVESSVTIPSIVIDVASTTTYYAKVLAIYSAGTPQYRGRLTAVRIA